jgi:hypothetical protein
VRRLFLLVMASAMTLSACGSGNGWPGGSSGPQAASQAPSQAPSIAATVKPTDAPTVKPTPTSKATPTDAPVPTGGTAIDANWTTLAPSGVGFTSMWPGKPTKKTSTSASSSGTVSTSLWEYDDSGDLGYFVGVVTYPSGALTGKKQTAIYDAAVKGMTTSTSVLLTISKQGDVTVNGHIGRGFTLTSTTASIQGAMILVGDILYMAYVVYTPAITDMSAPEVFFNDFNLTI